MHNDAFSVISGISHTVDCFLKPVSCSPSESYSLCCVCRRSACFKDVWKLM